MATTVPQTSENATTESANSTQQTPEPDTSAPGPPLTTTTTPTTTTTTTTEATTTTIPNTPSSTATEPKTTTDDGPGLGPIIGGAVGGVVVVAVIVIIVILCRKRRKHKSNKTPLPPHPDYVDQILKDMLRQEEPQAVEPPENTDNNVLYQNLRDTGIIDVPGGPQLDADGYLKKTSKYKGLGGADYGKQNGQGLSPALGIKGQAKVRCDIELRNGEEIEHIYGNQEVAVAHDDVDSHIYGNDDNEAVYTNETLDPTNAHAHVVDNSVIAKPAAETETGYVNTRRSDDTSQEDYEVVERPNDGTKDGKVGPKYANLSQHVVNSEQEMYELP